MIPFDNVTNHQVMAVNFGDKRLNARFVSSYAQMEKRGFSRSFPDIFQATGPLKRFYELMNNEKVTPQRFNDAYLNGLAGYFLQDERWKATSLLFNYQDTTYAKYNGRQVSLGYTETEGSNGVVVHSGILTGPDHIPLGISHQAQIVRDRASFGKKADRQSKAFDEKESYKWAEGLHWAVRFNRLVPVQVVQVADRECDIADFFNLAFRLGQLFLVRAMHDRTLVGTGQRLSAFIRAQEVAFTTERPLLDANGREHLAGCAVKCARVHLQGIDEAVWAVHLEAIEPPQGMEQTEWTLLTNLPVGAPGTAAAALMVVEAYTKRWRTTEDFHKCLKSGCGIEQRQFTNAGALLNVLSLMSIAAVRLLRTRHMAEAAPDAPIGSLLGEEEGQVATALARRFLKPIDLEHCRPNTVLWWALLLGRMGGHLGYSQKGLPGWITLYKGWNYFQSVMDGINLSKNLYGFSP
jgi:hypothetical protein